MASLGDNHHRDHRIENEIARIFDNNTRYRRQTPQITTNDDHHNITNQPPLASPDPELVENAGDDHQQISNNQPYPGIDDGFFNEQPDNDEHNNNPNTDVEILTNNSNDDHEIPEITPRAGPDGGDSNDTDETDANKPLNPAAAAGGGGGRRRFPLFPDLEIGGTNVDIDGNSIPDVNVYQHKKTLAQGMMDLALFSANANQLRYVLESGNHPYFYPSVILISISLILQVAIGIGLTWNATYNVKDDKEICIANKINNFTVIGIFLVTVVNVFISAFGVGTATAVVVTNPT